MFSAPLHCNARQECKAAQCSPLGYIILQKCDGEGYGAVEECRALGRSTPKVPLRAGRAPGRAANGRNGKAHQTTKLCQCCTNRSKYIQTNTNDVYFYKTEACAYNIGFFGSYRNLGDIVFHHFGHFWPFMAIWPSGHVRPIVTSGVSLKRAIKM